MKLTEQWFVVADTHFGHEKLCTLTERPENYNELIIEGWNSVVTKHDSVLFLGDLSFVNKAKTAGYCSKLKGRKWMIRGNHDSANVGWYADCGFTVVEPIFKRFKDKYDNWLSVLFTHEPVFPLPEGWINIHGHLHGNSHRGNVPDGIRHFDVGVDPLKYVPIRIYKVLDEFRQSVL